MISDDTNDLIQKAEEMIAKLRPREKSSPSSSIQNLDSSDELIRQAEEMIARSKEKASTSRPQALNENTASTDGVFGESVEMVKRRWPQLRKRKKRRHLSQMELRFAPRPGWECPKVKYLTDSESDGEKNDQGTLIDKNQEQKNVESKNAGGIEGKGKKEVMTVKRKKIQF